MPRFRVFAKDSDGKEHQFPSNNPYPVAVFYMMDADKYLRDMKAELGGSDAWDRKLREYERMKVRGAFGNWRLCGLTTGVPSAKKAAASRSKDWGVCKTFITVTRIEDVTDAK